MIELLISGSTAAVLTLFDLDRTFYVPARTQRKIVLYLWWCGFIFLNAVIAASLLVALKDAAPFKSMQPWTRAFVVGLVYLAVIRAKVTTFSYQGRNVPFGPEALYEAAKSFVYKRINKIAMAARYDETIALSNQYPLSDLATRARLAIRQNAIMSEEEKQRAAAWLLSVLQDPNSMEFDKKSLIADFILSGRQS
jgi:hypothetical protein